MEVNKDAETETRETYLSIYLYVRIPVSLLVCVHTFDLYGARTQLFDT